ncbi:unnamed protein product [Polarella glacialis]|uniref:EF-hand domain-containing protein n=1 Tax=Polarella glacialis TaxID=89957 RepID=A0A813J8Y1_POLGL|nr:unnamed protein product [Polarella glacialis]
MAPKLQKGVTRSNIISSEFDTNGDGRVLRSEVRLAQAKAAEEREKKARRFSRRTGVSRSNILDVALDANGDGRVTRSETRAARARVAKSATAPPPKKVIKVATGKQATKAMKATTKKNMVMKKPAAMKAAPKQAAAPISLQAKAAEEREKKARRFSRRTGVSRSNILDVALDANGDGRVTRSETRAARARVAKSATAPPPKKVIKVATQKAPPKKVIKVATGKQATKAMKATTKKNMVMKKPAAMKAAPKQAAAPISLQACPFLFEKVQLSRHLDFSGHFLGGTGCVQENEAPEIIQVISLVPVHQAGAGDSLETTLRPGAVWPNPAATLRSAVPEQRRSRRILPGAIGMGRPKKGFTSRSGAALTAGALPSRGSDVDTTQRIASDRVAAPVAVKLSSRTQNRSFGLVGTYAQPVAARAIQHDGSAWQARKASEDRWQRQQQLLQESEIIAARRLAGRG